MAWIISGWWLRVPSVELIQERDGEKMCNDLHTKEKTWASGPIPRILVTCWQPPQILGKICSSFLSWLLKLTQRWCQALHPTTNRPFDLNPSPPRSTFATIPREHIIVVSINQSLNPWISIFMCHFVTTRNTQTIYQHCFRKILLACLDTFVTNQNLPVYIKRASSCQHSLICYWFPASPRLPPKVL